MIETRGVQPMVTRRVSSPHPFARLLEGREVLAMPTPRTIDGARNSRPPASALVMASVVPRRSLRRATARRASMRRATARDRKDDLEGRIMEYLEDHPQGTTRDIAKGLNADRGAIAAELSHMVSASEITRDHAVR
jgi:hypothetical protein